MAVWIVGAAVLLGVVLAGFWLAERPVRGAARWAAVVHGVLGAAGTALAVAAGPGLAAGMLGLALAGGLVIVVAQLRRRRPAGLVVMLHATMGVAGTVLLVAALS